MFKQQATTFYFLDGILTELLTCSAIEDLPSAYPEIKIREAI
jgi:hypothetical protein